MSWAEDKFDATRQSEEAPCALCGHMVRAGDWTCFGCWPSLRPKSGDYGDDWHCHDCGNAGKTPWDPTEGCPRYPCHAFKPAHCATCPICFGWVL